MERCSLSACTIIYEIHVQEVLDQKWAAFFSPSQLSSCEEKTVLIGPANDQAELFGVLLKIRDSGLQLLAVYPAV